MNQLSFRLDLPPRLGAEDFLVAPANAAAREALERWRAWPDRVLLLLGPAGAGKTHLATLWASLAGAAFLDGARLDETWREAVQRPGVIDGADSTRIVETALFHLLNGVRERGSALLITARDPPSRWPWLTLPDLASRLRLAPSVSIGAPDDAMIRAVLVKHFADRQLQVEANLIEYLAARIDRSFAAVAAVVSELDQAGLRQGRRITRAVAADVLDRLGRETRHDPSFR